MLQKNLLFAFLLSACVSAPAFAQAGPMRNGLPPTSTDSFVYEAGGQAINIYGDEGDVDIPPFFSFTKDHRINSGIFGQRNEGLTTGHGSFLPDAWGGDEWHGNEWDQSGNNGGTIPPITIIGTPPPQNAAPIAADNTVTVPPIGPTTFNQVTNELNAVLPGAGSILQTAAQGAGLTTGQGAATTAGGQGGPGF
ncbi:MAG TPA: hypothetical protein V6C72_07415 [Chroococcales cyanobacterium]